MAEYHPDPSRNVVSICTQIWLRPDDFSRRSSHESEIDRGGAGSGTPGFPFQNLLTSGAGVPVVGLAPYLELRMSDDRSWAQGRRILTYPEARFNGRRFKWRTGS